MSLHSMKPLMRYLKSCPRPSIPPAGTSDRTLSQSLTSLGLGPLRMPGQELSTGMSKSPGTVSRDRLRRKANAGGGASTQTLLSWNVTVLSRFKNPHSLLSASENRRAGRKQFQIPQ